ncbi:head maturation protease, ClpP-related [Faecalibacterium prausnitzii]|uniref:head maturation protease, ClpP-related n=1 Tax=Faecalibacterium prausnitzii TaxID=853 RepID=UPI00356AAA6A
MQAKNNAPQVNIQRPCYAMASTDGQNADITMYGQIVETQPIDWWTDEPIPGQYIIESEFLNDLAQIEGCSQITIRMDSLGGDAGVSILIHNRLRELAAKGKNLVCIVDGVAMSGGSLIMCACDTVKVNPSSLVMIHKCWSHVWGNYNADELRKAADANDAWDKSQVSIYKRKTGMSETVLLHMMADTTYMTGKEAVEKGFANELLDDAEPVAISASADRHTIFAKGHALRLPGVKLPDSIPLAKATAPAAAANTPAAPAAQSNEGGQSTMANNANPATVTPAAENPQAAVDAAVSAERNRLAEIDSVANLFDPALVQEAKYGETACDARELAFRAAKAAAAQGHEFLRNLAADNAASGAQNVEAVPGASASGSPESLPDAKGNVPKTQAERMAAADAAVGELLDDDKK